MLRNFKDRNFLAIGIIFMSMNVLLGSWFSRLPELQTQLHLSEGRIGRALLFLPLGALIGTTLTNRYAAKFPAGKRSGIGILVFCFVAFMLSFAWDFTSLCVGLFTLGLLDGLTNVSMNTAANDLELLRKRKLLSGCHGMFSLGGFLGAIWGAAFAALRLSMSWQLGLAGLCLALLILQFRRQLFQPAFRQKRLVQEGVSRRAPRLNMRYLGLLAVIGFCVMIAEGAISDWSTLYLRNELGTPSFAAPLGFGLFSFAMAFGRFSGDSLRNRFGPLQILGGGSILAASGLLLAILWTAPTLAILGFGLTGLGLSIQVPVLFGMAARTTEPRPSRGITIIANAGITGFLLAPPGIGLLSETYSIRLSLGLVALLIVLATWLTRALRLCHSTVAIQDQTNS